MKAAAPSPLWAFQHNENRSDRSSIIQRNCRPEARNGESSESPNTTNIAAAAAASAAIQCNRRPQTRARESSSMSPHPSSESPNTANTAAAAAASAAIMDFLQLTTVPGTQIPPSPAQSKSQFVIIGAG